MAQQGKGSIDRSENIHDKDDVNNGDGGWAQWLLHVISALRKWRQEDREFKATQSYDEEFKASLSYRRLSQKTKTPRLIIKAPMSENILRVR